METNFARQARELALSPLQRELVVGALLGDAYLMPTTAGYSFRVHHGLRQRTYVDWKHGQLHQFVRTAPREVDRSYYFRTVTHPAFSALRAEFYGESGRKTVPQKLLWSALGARGLAVWFMDDGAREECSSASTPSHSPMRRMDGWRSFCELNLASARL